MFKTGLNPIPHEAKAIDHSAEIGRMKSAYHVKAQNLSWEEKVASIERMREASMIARESMRKRGNTDGKLPEGAVIPPDLSPQIA